MSLNLEFPRSFQCSHSPPSRDPVTQFRERINSCIKYLPSSVDSFLSPRIASLVTCTIVYLGLIWGVVVILMLAMVIEDQAVINRSLTSCTRRFSLRGQQGTFPTVLGRRPPLIPPFTPTRLSNIPFCISALVIESLEGHLLGFRIFVQRKFYEEDNKTFSIDDALYLTPILSNRQLPT